MRTEQQTFAIVGAGFAGAKAAETLREEGFDGRVVLLGAEAERPYERPPLSKDYLRGESDREAASVHAAGFYAEHDIELRTGERGDGLDAAARRARARRRRAARLRPAAAGHRRRAAAAAHPRRGARRRPPPADVRRQRRAARAPGGGRQARRHRRRLDRGRGRRLRPPARHGRDRHRSRRRCRSSACSGSRWARSTATCTASTASSCCWRPASRRSRATAPVERVRTPDGRTIDCDAVVVGVGAAPRSELAAAAGLGVENGVLVDARLETSVPGIFAAGDLANQLHPALGRLRVEHWDNALHQGPAAARGMLGARRRLRAHPVLLLRPVRRRHGVLGVRLRGDRVVFRGDPARASSSRSGCATAACRRG